MSELEGAMSTWKSVVVITGLISCDVGHKEVVVSNPPPQPDVANPPPSNPGLITQPALSKVGDLNARSENLGVVFASSDGKCFLRTPSPQPLPSGATGPIQEIDCTEEMKHSSFAACDFGVVSRKDAQNCICSPWAGNPPPPDFAVDCPEKRLNTDIKSNPPRPN